MPAIADKAVWEKISKGRAGIIWDSVVEGVWKDIGGNPKEVLSLNKCGGYRTHVNKGVDIRERLALRDKVKSEKR